MKYHYIATATDGRITEGDMEAGSITEVLAFLAGKNFKPVSIKKSSFIDVAKKRLGWGQVITTTDQVFLAKYLSLMLRVGTDLLKVIDILIADFSKSGVKSFLLEVRSSLEKGQPFYAAFARYPQYFPSVFVNLVKAGEASGNLDKIFENLSVSLERERSLKSRIISALIYPAILLLVAGAILVFLITFALPKIANVFSGSGFNPPTFSRIVFAVGEFLSNNFLWVGTLLAGIVLGSAFFFFKTKHGKQAFYLILAKLPVVSDVFQKISVQRFASTLASLMKAGLPILESLHTTADVLSYPGMRESLYRIADQGVAKGAGLGASFHKESAFPQVVSQLVSISEKSGHTEEILANLADFYESEIDVALKRLVSLIEPLMLLMIGGIIGLVALAVIMPIYQLVGQF